MKGLYRRVVCSFIGHDPIIRFEDVVCYRCRRVIREEAPPMPTGVEIVHMNGSRYKVDLKYAGQDYGIHVWEISTPFPRDEIVAVEVEECPPSTTIEFEPGTPA